MEVFWGGGGEGGEPQKKEYIFLGFLHPYFKLKGKQ
jgi:hypothetical protein